jgi:hypothetical protein
MPWARTDWHRTLKAETARPARASFSAQQRAFDRFQAEYNEERPHEALGQQVPASLYRPSLRSCAGESTSAGCRSGSSTSGELRSGTNATSGRSSRSSTRP